MNKSFLSVGAAAIALIAAGTIYAMQSGNTLPSGMLATGPVNELSSMGSAPSADEIANGPRTVVPQGTTIELQLQTRLSTKTNNMGDTFDATVTAPVSVNGRVAIPAGAALSGHLILVRQPGRDSGRGQLQLSYDEIAFGGHSYQLGSRSDVLEGSSDATKDIVLTDEGDGSVGARVSTMTRGPQLVLEQGTALTVCLDEALHVRRT